MNERNYNLGEIPVTDILHVEKEIKNFRKAKECLQMQKEYNRRRRERKKKRL